MNLETTEEELMHTIFPHPTLSETMKNRCSMLMDAFLTCDWNLMTSRIKPLRASTSAASRVRKP